MKSPRSVVKSILIFSLGTWLVACGGGGSGEADGIDYTGNASRAVITMTNAGKLVNIAIGNAATSGTIAASRDTTDMSVEEQAPARLALRLGRYLSDSLKQSVATGSVAARIDVDQIEPCESGSFRITGGLSDDGTGTLTISFNSCRFGDETLNGIASLRIDALDIGLFIITDATYSFKILTLTSPGASQSVGGAIRSQVNIAGNSERLTANLVIRDNIRGSMSKTENLVIVDVFDNSKFPPSLSETIDGRVFDSVHGFVDISTQQPLVYTDVNQPFASRGQLLMVGAANASVRISVVSAITVSLEIDLDGDAAYETVASLRWDDLSKQAGSDLGDSDGDGMHNGWELANGFDPLDPADALLDPDNDGFSNIREYRAGTDPHDIASVPPPEADLEISQTDSPDPVGAGTDLTYQLTVRNLGPNIANDLRVEDMLPPGSIFASVFGSGWNCSEVGGTVICTRGSLAVGATSTISININAPNSNAGISNNASVAAATADFNLTNNVSTEATEVVGGANQIIEIALATNDLVYDPIGGMIYASVPGSAGSRGNSITPIDPATGLLGTSVFIGSEPGPLAISEDGLRLFAGLDGAAAIRPFDIATQTAGTQFALGSDSLFGPYYAEDIAVQRGSTSVIAVSLKYIGFSPRHAGVAIFDNGVVRPVATAGHTGSNAIEFSASPTTLYGYNNETTGFGFRSMLVDASGVTVTSVTPNLVSGFNVDIEFEGGRIYSTSGRVIDPDTSSIAGTFSASGPVEADAVAGRVFFLTGSGSTRSLQAYDANTFLLLGSLGISGVNGDAGDLIRWGVNGLAFRTSQNQIFIIETSLIP